MKTIKYTVTYIHKRNLREGGVVGVAMTKMAAFTVRKIHIICTSRNNNIH